MEKTRPAPEKRKMPSGGFKSLTAGDEPWYYLFLDRYANIIMWLGFGIAGLALVGALIGFLVAAIATGFSLVLLLYVFWLFISILGIALFVLGILYAVALIRLFVDAARNIREVRKNTEQKM